MVGDRAGATATVRGRRGRVAVAFMSVSVLRRAEVGLSSPTRSGAADLSRVSARRRTIAPWPSDGSQRAPLDRRIGRHRRRGRRPRRRGPRHGRRGPDGRLSEVEESVFRAVNDLPGWLEPVAWPFQQLGALFVGPLVAVVALALHRYRLAIAALRGDGGEAGGRAGREGDGQPATTGDVGRGRHRGPRRRAPRRGELRVRARRPGRRPGLGRRARTSRVAGSWCRGCSSGP